MLCSAINIPEQQLFKTWPRNRGIQTKRLCNLLLNSLASQIKNFKSFKKLTVNL